MTRESHRAGSEEAPGEDVSRREGSSASSSPLSRKGVGMGLGVGSLVVVGYELVGLVTSLESTGDGVERGATYTILLMILVTFVTVGGIGYGLFRAVRDEGPSSRAIDER